jgi:hypothetical protein
MHPHQEERFIVLAGEAHFTLAGERRVARAGETVVVPAGVRHSEGNPGLAEITAVVELRPARRTKEFHEAVAGLRADGGTTPRGAPKNRTPPPAAIQAYQASGWQAAGQAPLVPAVAAGPSTGSAEE